MRQIGPYEMEGELGRGAMGIVYRGLDPMIRRPVAVKTIRLSDVDDSSERSVLEERLLREARSAGILSHPNIVTVYHVGRQDDLLYIGMEFVNGCTLGQSVTRGEPMQPARVLDVIRQTAAALDYAHQQGVVHRDVKPANIMICDNGVVKMADFGVAKMSSQNMTRTGMLVGTPSYMSPEQIKGESVDGRSDQYALAIIAYELLTGAKPFKADTLTTLMYKIVHEEPLPPQQLNPSLGRQVEVVLRKALAKNPQGRFATCSDFADSLAVALALKKSWNGATVPVTAPVSAAPELPDQETVAVEPQLTVETVRSRAAARREASLEEPTGRSRFGKREILLALSVVTVAVFGLLIYRSFSVAKADPVVASPAKPQPSAPVTQPLGQRPGPVAARKETVPPPAGDASITPAAPAKSSPLSIDFQSVPSGAMVVVDGKPDVKCQTPCSLTLEPGRHTLVAAHPGHRPLQRAFQSDDAVVSLELAATTGSLIVKTTPPGAMITIDGQKRAELTPAILTLPAGKYRIEVAKAGFVGDNAEIEVRDNGTRTLAFELPEIKN